MASKLYIGNGTATPSIVVEKPTPMPCTIQKKINNSGILVGGDTIIDLNGATSVGTCALYGAYYGNTSITGAVDMSSLREISSNNACTSMFQDCTGITSVDLGSLQHITHNQACSSMFRNCTNLIMVNLHSLMDVSQESFNAAFQGCTKLTTVDLSSFKSINGCACQRLFSGCTSLVSIDLHSLTTIPASYSCTNMFNGCTSLTIIDLSSLNKITGGSALANAFQGCTSLKTLSFPSLDSSSFGSYKDQFNNMLKGVTGCTLHFPSNLDPESGSTVISSLTSYPNFGGTSTILSFDLPATE